MFDANQYLYPAVNPDIKDKLVKLKISVTRLEHNLIQANSKKQVQSAFDRQILASYWQSPFSEKLAVNYANELNLSQLLAASTVTGKALVIAGAGSGKTKTLTYRTSFLIENGVSPQQILLLTFTRKAANEIKTRVKTLLSAEIDDSKYLNHITSGTFHAFCNMLLRRYAKLLGIHPKFTILDTLDAEDALDLLIKEKKYPIDKSKQAFPRKSTLQKILSTSRNRRILLNELIEKDYPDLLVHLPIIEQVALDFHQYKRKNHLYDFDDIIGQVVYHLKHNAQFLKKVQATYKFVMVDEYQDTNIPQKQLIDLICQPNDVSLMVVGDDNQSIYAFRGANYQNILLFADTYPNAKLIKLEQNYRSTPAILDFVNGLSEQITLGYQKHLFSDLASTGKKPVFCRRSDEKAEAKLIVDTIIDLKPNHDYKDFAILCRTTFQTSFIQIELMDKNIPFVMVGGIKFIEKRHIKDVLAFVKILYNPNDAISWHRLLTLFKGIGSVTATKLTAAIQQQTEDRFAPLLDKKVSKKNQQLTDLYELFDSIDEDDSISSIIDKILAFYLPMLKVLEENWRIRSEDFRVLQNLAGEYTRLDQFLEHLALDPPNDSVAATGKAPKQVTDAVTISTIHSAKGLEWSVVFVNSLVDGMMPHHRSMDDFEALEEERKLFYVACSRAKTHLYLTAPDYYTSFSGYFDDPSRFIAEVGSNLIAVDAPNNNKKINTSPIQEVWW